MTNDEHRLVERIAYDVWLRRGQPIGSPEVDWEEALKLLASVQRSQQRHSPAPGSMPTDLGVEPVPELTHDVPSARRRDRTSTQQKPAGTGA